MISASDITVIAPDFYTSSYSTRYLRTSAERHGVPIRFYGTGEPYRGWLYTQIERLHDELTKIDTRYVIYTDSSDALFLSPLGEIALKMERHCRAGTRYEPALFMSAEHDGKLCAGGWWAKTGAAIDALLWLGNFSFDGDDGNPQTRWREAIADGEIDDVELDTKSWIFQVSGNGDLIPYERRLTNESTGTYPCLLHFAGGYTDPVTGKSDLIEPVWRQLGYEATI